MNIKNEFEKTCDLLIKRWEDEGKNTDEMYAIWSQSGAPALDEIMLIKLKSRSKQ
jgi:hypothetical protein